MKPVCARQRKRVKAKNVVYDNTTIRKAIELQREFSLRHVARELDVNYDGLIDAIDRYKRDNPEITFADRLAISLPWNLTYSI